MTDDLNLNAFRLALPSESVAVETLPFETGTRLDELRREHLDSHVFLRQGDSVMAVPFAGTPPGLGGVATRLELTENLGIAARLWREGLLRHLHDLRRTIVGARPLRFISTSTADDLLARILLKLQSRRTYSLRQWMQCRVCWKADARILRPVDGPPQLVAVVGATSRREFIAPLSVMVDADFDPTGLWVGTRSRSSWDSRIEPRLRLRGRVRKVADRSLVVDDGAELQTHSAEDLFLAGDHDAIEAVLRWAAPNDWRRSVRQLREAPKHVREGGRYLERIRKLGDYLSKNPLEIVDGVSVSVEPTLLALGGNFPVSRASSPTYVFDAAGRKTHQYNSTGLAKFGPYSQGSGISHRPRICIICQPSQQGRVEQFVYKFLHGISGSVFDKGFARTYALDVPQPLPFVAQGASVDAYLRAARTAMEHANSEGTPWDLALVQSWSETLHMPPERNPYIATKAFFLGHQIPVQAFRIETAELPEAQLPYTLSNMGLASYAKLGGIPWVLKADPTVTHELVFGMASAWMKRHRLDAGERLVGITTVFSGDGNYFLHTISKAVPMEEYQDAMLDSVRRVFAATRAKLNWQAGDRVRLVFHAFKPMRGAEAAAVMEAVSEMKGLTVEIAFLHVADDIGYEVLAPSSNGMKSGNGQRGRRAPDRGHLVELSKREALLTTVGPRELKRAHDGLPSPLSLKLHPDSSFTDMRYLAQQVFSFSGHSWQGFHPSPMPVTIAYSRLVAQLMAKLARAPQWNPDALYGRIGTTRWFL